MAQPSGDAAPAGPVPQGAKDKLQTNLSGDDKL